MLQSQGWSSCARISCALQVRLTLSLALGCRWVLLTISTEEGVKPVCKALVQQLVPLRFLTPSLSPQICQPLTVGRRHSSLGLGEDTQLCCGCSCFVCQLAFHVLGKINWNLTRYSNDCVHITYRRTVWNKHHSAGDRNQTTSSQNATGTRGSIFNPKGKLQSALLYGVLTLTDVCNEESYPECRFKSLIESYVFSKKSLNNASYF